MLWMSGKWEAFADEHGVRHTQGNTRSDDAFLRFGDKTHAMFDEWLVAGVAAGRWKDGGL